MTLSDEIWNIKTTWIRWLMLCLDIDGNERKSSRAKNLEGRKYK
jgi:hypothetical protein